jgi:hypothetical protein
MTPEIGEEIYFCSVLDKVRHKANILNVDSNNIIIKTEKPFNFKTGQSIVLITEDGDIYTEILDIKDQNIILKNLRSERREYFRIDDFIPVIFKKVESDCLCRSPRLILGYVYESDVNIDKQDESISPALWNLLISINRKLEFLIERLTLESEGLTKIDFLNVNLSASGIRFISNERFNKGDGVEVKMLLPTHPPTGIIAYGCVVRIEDRVDGRYEVALKFSNMSDDVRDEIIKYTINRQREMLKRNKDELGKNA